MDDASDELSRTIVRFPRTTLRLETHRRFKELEKYTSFLGNRTVFSLINDGRSFEKEAHRRTAFILATSEVDRRFHFGSNFDRGDFPLYETYPT